MRRFLQVAYRTRRTLSSPHHLRTMATTAQGAKIIDGTAVAKFVAALSSAVCYIDRLGPDLSVRRSRGRLSLCSRSTPASVLALPSSRLASARTRRSMCA